MFDHEIAANLCTSFSLKPLAIHYISYQIAIGKHGRPLNMPKAETSQSTPIEPLAMSVDQMAEALGISRQSAYQAVQRGDIPSWRLRGRILISRTSVRRLLEGEGSKR
jgi:excisionase family DNA binding protein